MQSSVTQAEFPAGSQITANHIVVLIVEDYEDCREMYAAYLTLAGFRVLKAANGLDALAIARRTLPDLILMDLGLPGIDGFETTRRLKQEPSTHDVPVVALTAQCLPHEEALREVGFESVLIKPCRPDDFAAHVMHVVRPTASHSAW